MTAGTQFPAGKARRAGQRRTLMVGSGAHALHDGYTDLIYVMLPIWQAEFALSYAAIGILRGVFAGTMAGLQIPAGLLSERLGPVIVLAGGTALAGLGYCLAGASADIGMLVFALLIGGLGASTQHPIASALVARAFAGPSSLRALGTYNFAGDIGKMTIPAAAAFLLIALPWRPTLVILGAAGFAAAAAILLLTPQLHGHTPSAKTQADGKLPAAKHAFPLLLTIGILDSATRMGFLTFLPFLLVAKGASLPLVGIALTLVFAGGAVGKLVCAFLGARIGATATMLLTEALTTLTIVALLPLPLTWAVMLLPLVGIALNGTSSVLYGSVPDLIAPGRHGRAFGIFYTGTIGAGAIAPVIYGLAGDALGLTAALIIVAATVLLTLPLALILRPALAAATRRP